MSKEYKVVRTYNAGKTCESKLQEAFDEGWKLERASEYVAPYEVNNNHYYGYIEYILSRKIISELKGE